MKGAVWAYRLIAVLCSPLIIGGLFGVLFWGDVESSSDNDELVSLIVLLAGLITIGVLDFKVLEWVGPRDWFAFAVIGAHLIQSAAFVFGSFFPFVLGVAGLDLNDVEEIAFECCWTDADEDFGRVFQEYFGLTAILAVFCTPVAALVWWASRALPTGHRP